jgi:hypothetical protein
MIIYIYTYTLIELQQYLGLHYSTLGRTMKKDRQGKVKNAQYKT